MGHKRASLQLDTKDPDAKDNLAHYLKFVGRVDEATRLRDHVVVQYGFFRSVTSVGTEYGKQIAFAATAGAAGIGKTTFARKAYDTEAFHELTGDVHDAFAACKDRDLRFRIGYGGSTVTDHEKRAPGTSIALRLLYQYLRSDPAFADPKEGLPYGQFWERVCGTHSAVTVRLKDVLHYILKGDKKKLPQPLPIVIVNIDETNALLDGGTTDREYLKLVLKEFARVLAERIVFVAVHLTGTHAANLYSLIQSSRYGLAVVSLRPLTMENKTAIVKDLASRCGYKDEALSTVVEHLLELVGGVGRYLEILMMAMSIAASGIPRSTTFSKVGFVSFLRNASSRAKLCSEALAEAALLVKLRYSSYLAYLPQQRFRDSAEVLLAFTLLRHAVTRDESLPRVSEQHSPYTIQELEQAGIVFLDAAVPLDPIPTAFYIDIPFLLIHIIYSDTQGSVNSDHILLGKLHCTLTPNENEQATLAMVMFRMKFAKLVHSRVWLSHVFKLRDGQQNVELKVPQDASFLWQESGCKVDAQTWQSFVEQKRGGRELGFVNGAQASFADSMVLCDPPLLIQDKQSVSARRQLLQGCSPGPVPKNGKSNSVSSEKAKCNIAGAIFVYVSDHKARADTCATLGPQDVVVLGPDDPGGTSSLQDFFGPTLALRRLLCFQDDSAAAGAGTDSTRKGKGPAGGKAIPAVAKAITKASKKSSVRKYPPKE